MASYEFFRSDRVIRVLAPDTSIQIQEVYDRIRDYEDDPINMDIAHIVNGSGKDDLGGGESVGITMVLINEWRLEFEARSGPSYIPCIVSGGNLVADNAYSDNPIKPTAFTQVQIRQSTSPAAIQTGGDLLTQADVDALAAGVHNADLDNYTTEGVHGDTVRRLAYGDSVWVSTVGGSAGTSFPIGTPGKPVSNFTDARTIAIALGLKKFVVRPTSGLHAMPALDFVEYTFTGLGGGVQLQIATGQDYDRTKFINVDLAGFGDTGGTVHQENALLSFLFSHGYTGKNCQVGSLFTVAADSYISVQLTNCYSVSNGSNIDAGGKNAYCIISHWAGQLTLKNVTTVGSVINISLDGGTVTIENTCTGGTINISGSGVVTDNSNGTTVTDETAVDVGEVRGSEVAAIRLATIEQTTGVGTVSDSAFTPTAVSFDANVPSAYEDLWNGGVVYWLSGNLVGNRTDIRGCTDQGGGNTRFVVTEMPVAPADGDTFIIG